jgi:uncharacterized protein YbjQ (UPF0145 family)
MKRRFVLSVVAGALMLTGCATEVKTLSRVPPGTPRPANGVQMYFGQQTHPAIKSQLGDVSFSVRIARKTSNPDDACHEALVAAVRKLRAAAHERNGNAVIDISTRFHSTQSHSSSDFTCGVSPSAAAIAVSGQVVVLEAD